MGAELEPPILHYVNDTFLIIDFHADCEYAHSYKPLDSAEFSYSLCDIRTRQVGTFTLYL